MGCIGDQFPLGIEDRAAKVPPLLDVHTQRRLLKHDSHLIGNRCNPLSDDFPKNRINSTLERLF